VLLTSPDETTMVQGRGREREQEQEQEGHSPTSLVRVRVRVPALVDLLVLVQVREQARARVVLQSRMVLQMLAAAAPTTSVRVLVRVRVRVLLAMLLVKEQVGEREREREQEQEQEREREQGQVPKLWVQGPVDPLVDLLRGRVRGVLLWPLTEALVKALVRALVRVVRALVRVVRFPKTLVLVLVPVLARVRVPVQGEGGREQGVLLSRGETLRGDLHETLQACLAMLQAQARVQVDLEQGRVLGDLEQGQAQVVQQEQVQERVVQVPEREQGGRMAMQQALAALLWQEGAPKLPVLVRTVLVLVLVRTVLALALVRTVLALALALVDLRMHQVLGLAGRLLQRVVVREQEQVVRVLEVLHPWQPARTSCGTNALFCLFDLLSPGSAKRPTGYARAVSVRITTNSWLAPANRGCFRLLLYAMPSSPPEYCAR
jgi:hypothetical protein